METKQTTYIVYCITNKITGMQYVGKTHYGLHIRWNRHVADALAGRNSCTYLARSIIKYGRENFEIVEVDRSTDHDSLIELETSYIMKFNTLAPNGYNLKLHSAKLGYICSEETKEKFRLNFYKNLEPLLKSKEMSEKLGKIHQGKKKTTSSSKYVGVFWSKEKQRWYSKLSKNGKPIRLGYFDSEHDAAESYDIAALDNFGFDSILNFPTKLYSYKDGYKPNKRSRSSEYPGVIRREKGKWVGWVAIVLVGENKRKTKIFSDSKYDNSELAAHVWRQNLIRELKLNDKPTLV